MDCLRVLPTVGRRILVGFDCFYVGRLRGTNGAVWQLTAIDCYSSYAWAELVVCKRGNPIAAQTSKLAHRVARELTAAGWQLERVLCDNGNEYRGQPFQQTIAALAARITHIRSGRPQTNGHVEALHRLILEECWRPAFARYLYPHYSGLRRELNHYLASYTRGRIPADGRSPCSSRRRSRHGATATSIWPASCFTRPAVRALFP